MRLSTLPPMLRSEPALTRAIGDPNGFVAVPEAARAVAIAALAQLSGRRPLVVACPTGGDAGQLYDDLCAFMPADQVLLFPAWETLPFERVSPSVETMGRRLEVLWRLRSPDRQPAVVVAGVRALLQRLGPGATEVEPVQVRRNDVLDPDRLLRRLIDTGYRREPLVEHRGEVSMRGAIIDVFPSTADAPIRIDLWGDEVDRLSEFSVNDQRSTVELDEVLIFPARELIPTAQVRERAAALVAEQPWGREQWERLAEGALFDGMESWLPWLVDDDLLLTNVLPAAAKVALVEPRRMRDRADDLLAEEDDLARSLASTWARDANVSFPRLHADTDRLIGAAHSVWTISSAPESPDSPMVGASGWGPVVGDGEGLANRLRDLLAEKFTVVVAADGEGSAQRMSELLLDRGLGFRIVHDDVDLTKPGGYIVVAPLHRGFTVPAAKLAVVAEADLTGRRRTHRKARPRRR
ncbi:MAG: mfd, partial [Ilumatobacteraceae bacterium]|nr:mfd [Ilumatobacteraceae bacterium]